MKLKKKAQKLTVASVLASSALLVAGTALAEGGSSVRCFGVNAVHRNDCKTATGSCAGTATKARDRNAYVFLPQGACEMIDGGTTKPSKIALKRIENFQHKLAHMSASERQAAVEMIKKREAKMHENDDF